MQSKLTKSVVVVGVGLAALSAVTWPARIVAADTPTTPRKRPPPENRDESKVPPYELPDALVLKNGQRVTDAETWTRKRRVEILELFRTEMFGRRPPAPIDLKFKVFDETRGALGGKATRKQVAVYFSADEKGPRMDLLLYIPASAPGPVPTFLGLNFGGNQAIHADPGIKVSESWQRGRAEQGYVKNRATEATRGTESKRWDVDAILDRGYALATMGTSIPILMTGSKMASTPCFIGSGRQSRRQTSGDRLPLGRGGSAARSTISNATPPSTPNAWP